MATEKITITDQLRNNIIENEKKSNIQLLISLKKVDILSIGLPILKVVKLKRLAKRI